MNKLSCFKAYDIRGQIPQDLNADIAYKIGVAYGQKFSPKKIIVGYDARLESPEISNALIAGLLDCGVDVYNIGLCGTEEVYFHAFHREEQGIDGGIMVTASHNPKGYNGMKPVTKGSRPISGATGLQDMHDFVAQFDEKEWSKSSRGKEISFEDKSDYIQHLLSYVNVQKLKPFKIVVNSGNGTAVLVLKQLEKYLPFEFIYVHEEVDGHFPNGIPNPLLPENRQSTIDAVKHHKADFGIAWDGDFDRCFLFDENGGFIEGYYIVGLLAEAFLEKHPGEKIIHDPRLTWNTIDCVEKAGGVPIQSKTGHAFIKEIMRSENAIYGGEMSAHHYFRDFAYCDSGMIPWLLVAELLAVKGKTLSQMVQERMEKYPCSGEINYKVCDAQKIMVSIEEKYKQSSVKIDKIDGISMEFDQWRFNLRSSNTEPLLRLNVESKEDVGLMNQKVEEIESFIKSF